jgi:Acetyltransferase (GNAT) domain
MSATSEPAPPPSAHAEPVAPAHSLSSPARWSAVVVRRAAELRPHLAAWDELAQTALEPNVFYESWLLVPALRAFGAESPLRFVLLYGPNPRNPIAPQKLCGFFPLVPKRGCKGVPVSYLTLWQHPFAYFCAPLLRSEVAAECLAFFFDWLATDSDGSALVELPCIAGQGPFHQLLVEHLNERAVLSYLADSYTRALLEPDADAESYLDDALTHKCRKELSRLLRRLGERGKLEFRTLQIGDALQPWLDDFLKLEVSGWKGREGTAITCQESNRTFFKEMAAGAYERGQLMMLGMFLDGRPVALKCNLQSGVGSFAFKIAFDEEFARYSPGVQLEIENIRRFHDNSGLHWMDSCAIFDHFMINRLWLERRVIQSVLISTGRAGGDLIVSSLPLFRWVKRWFARRRPAPVSISQPTAE